MCPQGRCEALLALLIVLVALVAIAAAWLTIERADEETDVRVSARWNVVDGSHPLPRTWDWTNVDDHDSDAYRRATGVPLRAGKYASDAVNQHSDAYCGCCFLVATLQCVQDRFNIKHAPQVLIGTDFRVHHFDLQAAVDEYSEAHDRDQKRLETSGVRVSRETSRGWNACMGGDPLDVGQALAADAFRLRRAHPWTQWSSRACGATPRLPIETREYPVLAVHPLPQDDLAGLKRALLRGPLVVGVRAKGLWQLLDGGVPQECGSSGGADRDHVVSVLGWTLHGGAEHWVARNSWGDGRGSRIYSRPADVRLCTPRCDTDSSSRGSPTCASEPIEWHNRSTREGIVLIPVEPATNCLGIYDAPSGWVEVAV